MGSSPDTADTSTASAGQDGLGKHEIERSGHLESLLGAGHDDDGVSRALDQSCVIGDAAVGEVEMGLLEHGPRKPCGVWTDRRALRSTVSVTTSPSTRLTVSVTGSPGTTASAPARTADATASISSTGARGRAASCTRTTPTASGSAASAARTDSGRVGAARHHVQRGPGVMVGQQRPHGDDLVGWRRHDDEVDQARRRQVAHGVHEQRHSAEQPQRLGRPGSEPLAAPGRRHDRRHLLGAVPRPAGHVVTPTGCANTMRPLAVVSTLVTTTVSSLPTESRARSTTIIVPSSR